MRVFYLIRYIHQFYTENFMNMSDWMNFGIVNPADAWLNRAIEITFSHNSELSILFRWIRENDKLSKTLKVGIGYTAAAFNVLTDIFLIMIILFSDNLVVLLTAGLLTLARYEQAILTNGTLAHAMQRKLCPFDFDKFLCRVMLPSSTLDSCPDIIPLMSIQKYMLIISGIFIKIMAVCMSRTLKMGVKMRTVFMTDLLGFVQTIFHRMAVHDMI